MKRVTNLEELQSYFKYLENVLGVKSIVSDSERSLNKVHLIINIENFDSYTKEEKDLLEKILAAMKLDEKKVVIRNSDEINNLSATYLVRFTDDNLKFDYANLILPSPRVLQRQPELKKLVWTELQRIMQKI